MRSGQGTGHREIHVKNESGRRVALHISVFLICGKMSKNKKF